MEAEAAASATKLDGNPSAGPEDVEKQPRNDDALQGTSQQLSDSSVHASSEDPLPRAQRPVLESSEEERQQQQQQQQQANHQTGGDGSGEQPNGMSTQPDLAAASVTEDKEELRSMSGAAEASATETAQAAQDGPHGDAAVRPEPKPESINAQADAASPAIQQAEPRYKPTHFRVDSVPPKRYEIDESDGVSQQTSNVPGLLSIPDEDDEYESEREAGQYHKFADEHLYFGAGHAMDRIASHMSSSITSEGSKPGQTFVEVQLEPGDLGSSSSMAPPPGSPFATTFEGRSSEQIRNDYISSTDAIPTRPSSVSLSTSDSANITLDDAAAEQTHARSSSSFSLDRPPLSPNVEKPLLGKPAEGRYRGRKSVASSRAPSPDPHASMAEGSGTPQSRRSSYIGTPGSSATPPRKAHGRNSSISSTSSSTSAVLSRRLSALPQSTSDKEMSKQALSIQTERLSISSFVGPVVVLSGEEDGERPRPEVASTHSVGGLTPTHREQLTPTGPTSDEPVDARSNHEPPRTSAGLDEEVGRETDKAAGKPSTGEQEAPSVPSRSTSINGSLSPAAAATATLSPGLSDKADLPQDPKARRRRSSAHQPVEPLESRTRMTTLPPKQKSEEIKHRTDFERIMMEHKEVERKRREEIEARRREREQERRESLVRWEKEILPSWTRARKDEELTQLWWKGAPPSIRGRVWALAIGNAMMLPRNLLDQAEKRIAPSMAGVEPGRKAIPAAVMAQIEADVAETLPSLKLFQSTGPLYDDLLRICRAFVLVRMEQVDEMNAAGDADRAAARMQQQQHVGQSKEAADATEEMDEYTQRGIQLYQPGLSTLAAILLINLPASTAFICLLNLINSKAWLKALYSLSSTLPSTGTPHLSQHPHPHRQQQRGQASEISAKEKGIRGFERVFGTLLADQMPKVYANLLAQRVAIDRVCLRNWVVQLWGAWLDVDTVMRLWDVVLLDETDSLIYRTSLALVQMLESRLYVPDKAELESVLSGTHRAALSIWRRDKELSGELDLHMHDAAEASSSASSLDGSVAHVDADGAGSASETARRRASIHEVVPKDYIYEQYGIREETMFAALEEQKAWWKQSTLERLLDRELGD